MTRLQKVLLSLSALCYLLVLAGLALPNKWIVLVAFILHSLLLLSFSYLAFLNNHDLEEKLMLEGKYKAVLTEKEDLVSNHAKEIEAMELKQNASHLALEEAHQQIEALQKTISEKDAAASDAIENAALALEKEKADAKRSRDNYEGLLPPIPETESQRDTVDIIAIAKETVAELKDFSTKAGLHVQISAPETTLLVKANASRLRIMFRNIIDNSIKYMNRAGSMVITISSIADDIFIVLKDTGEGLDSVETEHIFELNYQGSNRISGNGLGLTQAKAIVTYYGGTIYAKSTQGNGMGIYIQLPTT